MGELKNNFFGCPGSSLLCGLPLVAASRGCSLVAGHGFLIAVTSHCRAQALGCKGSVVVVHGFSCPAAWAYSQTRDQTHVPCIGRQILNHWTTREVPDGESEAQGCDTSSQRSHSKLGGTLSPSLSDQNVARASHHRAFAQTALPAWAVLYPTPLWNPSLPSRSLFRITHPKTRADLLFRSSQHPLCLFTVLIRAVNVKTWENIFC